MKALRESLKTAIETLGRKDDSNRLIEAIEKMALALIPAAKNAVSPIGLTCDTIKFSDGKQYHTTIDKAIAALDKANMMLVAYGANDTRLCIEARDGLMAFRSGAENP